MSKTQLVSKARQAPRKRATSQFVSKNQVRQMLESKLDNIVELHYVFPSLASTAQTATPIVTGLTDITVDDLDTGRTGDKIALVTSKKSGTPFSGSLQLRMFLQVDLGNDVTQQIAYIRVIIFQWHPQTTSGGATEPTSTLLLGTAAPTMNSFHWHDTRQMYTVVYDEVFGLIGPGGSIVGALPYNTSVSRHVSAVIPLSSCQQWLQYSAASATIATNHLYLMSFSNLAADAQNPTLEWAAKLFFTDA